MDRNSDGTFAKGRINENKGQTIRQNICAECGISFIRKTPVKSGVHKGRFVYSRVKYCEQHKYLSRWNSERASKAGKASQANGTYEKTLKKWRANGGRTWNLGQGQGSTRAKNMKARHLIRILKKKINNLNPKTRKIYTLSTPRIKKTPEELLARKRFGNQRYKANKRNAEGTHTFKEWEMLKEYYNYMCLCCKRFEPEIKLSEDHIFPLSLGGSDMIENIQPLCVSCNTRKHARFIDYRGEVNRISLVN